MIRNTIIALFAVALVACGDSKTESTSSEDEVVEKVTRNATMPVDESDTIAVVAMGANMSEMSFDKKAIRVPANKEITIKLTNESTDASMPHNLVFIKKGKANDVGQAGVQHKDNAYVSPDDENVIAHSPLVQIGETVYFTFTTPPAGRNEFICSYPGHWGIMKGKFITK